MVPARDDYRDRDDRAGGFLVKTWLCKACGCPVADNEGSVHVDAYTANNGGTTAWECHHYRCEADDGTVGNYWIDVSDLRDATGVNRWTAHMSEKRWFSGTDWWGVMWAPGKHRANMVL